MEVIKSYTMLAYLSQENKVQIPRPEMAEEEQTITNKTQYTVEEKSLLCLH